MLTRGNSQRESVADSTKLLFIKVHRVNAGVNKILIQQLARAHVLISNQVKLITPMDDTAKRGG